MESLFATSPWVQVQVNAIFTKPSCDVIKIAKSKTRVDKFFAIWGTFTELYRFAVPFKDSIVTRSINTKDWNLKTYYRIEKLFIFWKQLILYTFIYITVLSHWSQIYLHLRETNIHQRASMDLPFYFLASSLWLVTRMY